MSRQFTDDTKFFTVIKTKADYDEERYYHIK